MMEAQGEMGMVDVIPDEGPENQSNPLAPHETKAGEGGREGIQTTALRTPYSYILVHHRAGDGTCRLVLGRRLVMKVEMSGINAVPSRRQLAPCLCPEENAITDPWVRLGPFTVRHDSFCRPIRIISGHASA